jgi:hypothetical protein
MQPSKKTEEHHPRAQACHASLTSPVLTHLNIPKNYVRTSSDSCGFKIGQKLGCHWSPFSISSGFAHPLSVIIAINESRSRCNGAARWKEAGINLRPLVGPPIFPEFAERTLNRPWGRNRARLWCHSGVPWALSLRSFLGSSSLDIFCPTR